MAFKSRRGAAARREVAGAKSTDDVEDDAGLVIRKDRIRRSRPAREPRPELDEDDGRPVIMSYLYSNGGLDQLRKDQSRITNTYSSYDRMEVDADVSIPQAQIPTAESIAAAKRKRQQLREVDSTPQYIPLQNSDQPVVVAGGLYGPGSGTSTLVREEDDDEDPDLLQSVPKVPLSTVLEDIEEDDQDIVGSPVSGSTMTVSEAEIHMAIVTRLEECRVDNAALNREAVQINNRLAELNIEDESITNQIAKAESKYIGLQELYATVSALLECVSGKSETIDQLWDENRDIHRDWHQHISEVLSLHWSDQDRPLSVRDVDRVEEIDDEATVAPETRAAVQARRRECSRKRRSIKSQAESSWMEGWTTYGDTDFERESSQLIMEIQGRSRQVFADVIDPFSSVDAVLKIFSKWRNSYREDYDNAYCDLSLPRLLAPYIKLILININVRSPKGLISLIAATRSIRAFSASVMEALVTALIGPFLTTSLMLDFSPFSMPDMIHCRAFCEQIREHFGSVEIATSLRMLLVQADDKRQGGRRLGSIRHWGRSLKLLFSMKTLQEFLGPESQFMITAVTNELKEMANTDRRLRQLASVLQRDVSNLSAL